MKSFFTGLLLFFILPSFGQSNTLSVKFSNAIIARYSPTINNMTGKGWEYSNTIITHGMEKVYNNVPTAAYLNYIQAYADLYIKSDGSFQPTVSLVSLDKIHPGITCLFLYEKTGLLKYKTAATALRNVLVGSSASYSGFKTPVNSIFWHKQSGYDNIMMLDGMYMAHPFLAKYGSLFNDNAAMDTAVNQVLFAYNQLYVSSTHLIKHAWKEPGSSGSVSWDDVAGNSTSVWSRAMGWYVMALVDILKYVPPAHPKRTQLLTALSNLAIGIKNYQDATTGLWYQVVDKTNVSLSGNYLETSGSAMFVYALKTAITNGWISSATYSSVVQNGWAGLQTRVTNYSDGKPMINNFAPAMSVMNSESLYVDASHQPVDCPDPGPTQHPHGYAAILMAASVMEFPLVTLPVKFTGFSAKDFTDRIRLSWQNGDETNVDHYEIERSVNATDFIKIGSMPVNGTGLYNWDDRNSSMNTIYYRIKALSTDASVHYSSVLPVRRDNAGDMLQVSPNPVKEGIVNIYLNTKKPGRYWLKIMNNAGAVMNTSVINSIDGSVVETITLPAGIQNGLYYVQLEGEGLRINKSILIK